MKKKQIKDITWWEIVKGFLISCGVGYFWSKGVEAPAVIFIMFMLLSLAIRQLRQIESND